MNIYWEPKRISSTIHRSLWYSFDGKEEEGGGVVGKTKKRGMMVGEMLSTSLPCLLS